MVHMIKQITQIMGRKWSFLLISEDSQHFQSLSPGSWAKDQAQTWPWGAREVSQGNF